VSLHSVAIQLANLCESPRISPGQIRNGKPLPQKNLRGDCESRESLVGSRACAGAHARTRARGAGVGERDSSVSRVSHQCPSCAVTILKLCRCVDCRNFFHAAGSPYCERGIGGTAFVWGTREHVCDPPPEAWHYCRDYHGPLLSGDAWAWPRCTHAEVAGPTGGSASCDRDGNGRASGLFRSAP